ncbi:cupin domain-containing protein [Nisaea sp.]|uniref:cupin domain-containing protein n=1 Tax=Nisaea sp. TaxID=2024842 RepID=UPI002B2781D1|nr:cupin domain-containing protein [Nisaea sp.]
MLGVDVSILATNAATGAYEITLQKGMEGMGPPPHSHPWDETFFILSGSVEVSCGDKTESCAAGALVHVPGGTVHAFRFGAEGGEMLEFTSAGGSATQMFADLANTIDIEHPDMAKAVKVLQRNGTTVHL